MNPPKTRPSELRNRLGAALIGPAQPAAAEQSAASTGDRGRSSSVSPPAAAQPRPRWEATHRRYTVHLPVDLIEAIAAESQHTGRSKARIVTDALQAYFHR